LKNDDNIADAARFWIHFWCGLIFGGGLGAIISWGAFDSRWAFIASTAAIALVVGYCCGRWGDSAWCWIIEKLPWLTW
jgi:hypothetical protein